MSKQTTLKLQKVIADTGFSSRRRAETLIEEGRVRVGRNVATIGMRVAPNAKIFIDDKPLRREGATKTRVLMFNKPPGMMCTRHDPEGRPTVFEQLPELPEGRWIAIGRLDFHTQGLLLFTNDGKLAHEMMHPKQEYVREYRVRVIGEVTPEMLTHLREGVELEDGPAKFDTIVGTGSAGGKNTWYKVKLREGRNRIVRRLFESQNITVSRLMRVRFGDYALPRELETGRWQEVTPKTSK